MPEDAEADSSPDTKPAPRLGSYILSYQLGSGGMSNVFRAVHEESGSVVALKVLPKTLAKNPTLLQRFLREAKSAEALDHPNIVAIYDRGFDQGRHYLVLEHVEGRDLHDRVMMNGPLTPEEGIRFIREVAEGLRYAAGRGMIHRDVKPANLLMTPDGHAKIIDLGLALQTEDEDERVTRDGTTVGTVNYMAPEQARDSRQTSERSDIYSLGCTFYYLLTGSQPYPGGGVADKLARHFKAPIPDPRELRPEVSEPLSLLIRRMMEKKPDRRFADYTELITALDALSDPSGRTASSPVVLDALIDDDEIALAPSDSAVTTAKGARPERPASSQNRMMAEIVDEEDDSPATPRSREIPSHTDPTEVSLADLAELDADKSPTPRTGRRQSGPTPPSSGGSASLESMLEEEEGESVEGFAEVSRAGSGPELSLRTWIAAGIMVGLAITIVGFSVLMVVSMGKPKTAPVVKDQPSAPSEDSLVFNVPTPRPSTKLDPTRPKPVERPNDSVLPPVPSVATPMASSLDEVGYSQEWESRLGPPSYLPEAEAADKADVVVRRVIEAGDEVQTASLASAFGRPGELIEIADTGPFFEDDCRIVGKSRLIRARPGFRPMIKIESTTQQVVREQEAKFILGGNRIEKLTLEGIDLAVDVRDLPEQQTTLFLCRGAEVTLRDCTLTVLNAGDRKLGRFSIFRIEEAPRSSRIVLERTTIRGPILSLVNVSAARAEVVVDRSIVVGESGAMFSLEPVDRPDRSLFFRRSVLASRGPILEIASRQSPPTIHSLGSTFARVEGVGAPGPIHLRNSTTLEPTAALDWSGEDNAFLGWAAWLTSGPELTVRVKDLAGIRAIWPRSDGSSREARGTWPANIAREEVVPADIVPLLPARKATLARIAVPHPRLRELTFSAMNRLASPELSASLVPSFLPPAPVAPLPGPNGVAPPPAQVDLTFDVLAAPWSGDIGQFLAEKIPVGTARATVRVVGGGVHASKPVKLPDGLSISILGEQAEGSRVMMPTFYPRPESTGRCMIELRAGDLALANLAFATDGVTRPKHFVRVEDGLLGIRHCRFRDSGAADPGVGPVISFAAAGSTPIVSRMGPFESTTDRPTARLKNCLIWTGGDALSVELARGAVELQNCLIISGGPAISLRPLEVRRDKFEADLVLERCTIADERVGIALGRWPGDPLGPERPWLISTRSCVFPRTQVGGTGALLVVDPEAMARGVLFWQSIYDAYEVLRFLASTGPAQSNPPGADIKKGWVDLWGPNHARNDRGPDPRRNEHVVRYKDNQRPKPGRVTPKDLELDPKGQKDLGVDFKDLPPVPKA